MDSYKLLVNLPDTVVFLSPELKVLEATDDYLATTMVTREELLGQNFLEMFPDNPSEQESKNMSLLRDSLMRAISSKKPDYLATLRYDIPRPQAKGGGFEERYWEAVHKPVLDESGNVLYVIQKTSDVTQREVAKRAAELEESKYKFMMNALPQLIYTLDASGEVTFLNQRWYDYTGEKPEILKIKNWEVVMHPEDYPVVTEKMNLSIKEEQELQAEMRLRNSRGAYRWFLVRCVPMRNETGNVILWVGSCVDIHDTRQLVMELADSNQQMADLSDQVQKAYSKAEAERKTLERLIMRAPIFFCILKGPEHRFDLVNEKYQQLLPNKDLLGNTVAEVLPEVVEQGFVKVLDDVYNTGKEFVAENIPVKLDRYNTGELEEMHLTFIYQAIYDEQQQVTGIMVCGYDVTEHATLKKNA